MYGVSIRYAYLIAAYLHFLDRFIDLTINSHTSPYNLASSRLLRVWDPYGVWGNCCELKL